MGTDDRHPAGTRYDAAVPVVAEPDSVLLPGHDVPLGRYTTVRRLLPQRPRRMVGAWCFVDQFGDAREPNGKLAGPDNVAGRPGMRVPPHPHTEEIVEAREDWQAGRRFGAVAGYQGDPLPAPPMPTTRLKARDRHGHMY